MKTLIAHVVAAALLSFGLAAGAAECVYPHAPDTMPDGATSTKDIMLAAKKGYDQYNADMAVYLDCIKTEHEASAPKIDSSMSPEKKKAVQKQIDDGEQRFVAKYDSAVDEVHAIMERFNEQIRAFNAKIKAEKEKSDH
jgi:hypothetical protein